jgi:hypothetical protein
VLPSSPEQCDLGAANQTVYGVKGGCTTACTASAYCGDEVVDPEEQCDLGDGDEGRRALHHQLQDCHPPERRSVSTK